MILQNNHCNKEKIHLSIFKKRTLVNKIGQDWAHVAATYGAHFAKLLQESNLVAFFDVEKYILMISTFCIIFCNNALLLITLNSDSPITKNMRVEISNSAYDTLITLATSTNVNTAFRRSREDIMSIIGEFEEFVFKQIDNFQDDEDYFNAISNFIINNCNLVFPEANRDILISSTAHNLIQIAGDIQDYVNTQKIRL